MHQFSDAEGREWKIRLTLASSKRVHDETDVWLSDIANPEHSPLDRLVSDDGFVGMVLWALCQPQVEERGLTVDEFLDAFDSEVCEKAREAIVEETLDFLGHRGQAIRKARAERLRIERELEEENIQELEGMTGREAMHALQTLLARWNSTPGDAPESAELTPAS